MQSSSSTFQLPAPRKTAATSMFQPRSVAVRRTGQGTTKGTTTTNNNKGLSSNTATSQSTTNSTTVRIPSYEERCQMAVQQQQQQRGGGNQEQPFVPRTPQDYQDGGAFPEIHIAQYPRNMGNPHIKKTVTSSTALTTTGGGRGNNNTIAPTSSSSRTLATIEIDKDGNVSYDAIVKSGTNRDRIVYTKLQDMQPNRNPAADDIALPTPEQEHEEAERTRAALQALVQQKSVFDKPSGTALVQASTSHNIEQKTQFIKYTAQPDAPGYNPAASANRVIQMIPAKVDPLMPPKHKHTKAPRGPAEDPVPVLQAPPRKLTKEEKELWNIPACISNWKNARGYTIPLDKRLAADGRGLLDNSVNADKFAALSESLYVAEQQARTEVRMRAMIQKKQLLQERTEREEELRQLANAARLQRGGAANVAPNASNNNNRTDDNETNDRRPVAKNLVGYDTDSGDSDSSSSSVLSSRKKPTAPTKPSVPVVEADTTETEDDIAARQREKLRIERKRERERELRMERNFELKKKQKLEEERDVSEKIALGIPLHQTGTGGAIADSGDAGEIDSRLYNTSSGLDSGFGPEDDYNTYTKPLFGGAGSTSIYRPSRDSNALDADEQYEQYKRSAPVQFEKEKQQSSSK